MCLGQHTVHGQFLNPTLSCRALQGRHAPQLEPNSLMRPDSDNPDHEERVTAAGTFSTPWTPNSPKIDFIHMKVTESQLGARQDMAGEGPGTLRRCRAWGQNMGRGQARHLT